MERTDWYPSGVSKPWHGILDPVPPDFAARCLDAGAQVHDSPRGGCVALPPELGGCWLFSERA